MTTEIVSFTGFLLMFVLGLRHGLDPDHIACIDGLTWRTIEHDTRLAPWVGTLFALGHGLLVTVIAAGVSQLTHSVPIPDRVVEVFNWLPTALLIMVGTLNLRLLLRAGGAYQPTGWKMKLIPARLRNHSNPLAIVLIGVLFATVFDTATQASAWGYVATSKGGIMAALSAGLLFTAGMLITDTLDSRLLCRIARRADGAEMSRRYRRNVGWLIVCLSYGVAGYNVAKAAMPEIEMDDTAYSLAGLLLLMILITMWMWSLWLKRDAGIRGANQFKRET
jgi:high-affinity nickel-transport protein